MEVSQGSLGFSEKSECKHSLPITRAITTAGGGCKQTKRGLAEGEQRAQLLLPHITPRIVEVGSWLETTREREDKRWQIGLGQ